MDAKELLKFDDLARRTITIKKWKNLKLEIVEMTGDERDRIVAASQKGGETDPELFAQQVILASVRDAETGKPFFDPETIKELKNKSWSAVEQLAEAVFEINELGQKRFGEVEKN